MIKDINKAVINNFINLIYFYKYNTVYYIDNLIYSFIMYYSFISCSFLSLFFIYKFNKYNIININRYYGITFLIYIIMLFSLSFIISYVLMFLYQYTIKLYINLNRSLKSLFYNKYNYKQYMYIFNKILLILNIVFFIFGLGEFIYYNINYKLYDVKYNIDLFFNDVLEILFNTVNIYLYSYLFSIFLLNFIYYISILKIHINNYLLYKYNLNRVIIKHNIIK